MYRQADRLTDTHTDRHIYIYRQTGGVRGYLWLNERVATLTDVQTDRQTDNYLASHVLGKNSYDNGQTNIQTVTITHLV